MQMKALRSANFAKLSSSNSTRDVYWDTSISAGTAAGYWFGQMRSMVFPLWFRGRAVLIGSDRGSNFCFDAFSSREPVPTPDRVRGRLSLENAMVPVSSDGDTCF